MFETLIVISELDIPVSQLKFSGLHFLAVTHCESYIVSKKNCIWNCKSKKITSFKSVKFVYAHAPKQI